MGEVLGTVTSGISSKMEQTKRQKDESIQGEEVDEEMANSVNPLDNARGS